MQYELTIFEYENRHKFQIIDRNGEPWFVLAEVCRELEIGNPSDAARRLDPDERDALDIIDPIGRKQRTTVINESGLYSVILTSRKPEAKRFKKWITSEVLPSIRKTGGYGRSGAPAFVRRFNENWDRVDAGHFSVLSEVMARVYGRFEMAGHLIADRSPAGSENRMDGSVGRRFSDWLKENHPAVSDNYSFYVHATPEWEGPVRQYPNSMLALFIEFVETVWIPKYSEAYMRPRDPAALPFLQKILPALNKPRAGTMRHPTIGR